jgi:preprotein translocase subunit YajC
MSQQIALLLFQQSSPFVTFIPLLLVFVLFYFLIIVPQRKRQRAVDAMLDNLKSGDKVVTNGGIYGTIVSIRDDKRTMQLKISENPVVRVEVARTAISGLQDAPAPAEEKK